MNIAFITPEYVTEKRFDGGLSNYIHKISLALHERGHNIFVIVSADKDEQFIRDGITIIRVNIQSRTLGLSQKVFRGKLYTPLSWIVQSWKLNKALAKLHESINFDIVQFASYTAVGIFAPKRIKSISRISSYQPLWDQANEIEISFSSKIKNYLELYALQQTNKIYGPSEIIAHVVSEQLGKPIEVLESPLPPNQIEVNQIIYTDSLKDKKYLLFFGSMGIFKGVKEIGEILTVLLSMYPDIHFVFIGKDMGYKGRPMLDYVWEQAGENRGRCIYLGSIKQIYLQPIVQNAFAVVLPSRIDNLPNTCTESMALGKIVIGTRGASFEQLIEDTKNGYLCDIADSNSLLSAIEEVFLLNNEQRLIIEDNAKKTVARLKIDIIVEKTEQLFKSIRINS